MISPRGHSVLIALATVALMRVEAADHASLTSVQLVELCSSYAEAPDTKQGRSCAAYLRGFLDGAADVMVRADEPDVTHRESFGERALRTRLGVRRRAPPQYCIDQGLSVQRFIAQLLEHAERNPPEPEISANAMVYGVLGRFHRCAR